MTDSTHGPHSSSKPFVPAGLDATHWESLEPLYRSLLERPLRCAGCLEQLILDRSELDAFASEAEANAYIRMTCFTDDAEAKARFLQFIEKVDPQLKKVGFELDRRIAESPFAKDLNQARYGVLLRALRQSVRLFRAENIPIETELTKLDQQYSEINGAMTVEFEGREQTMPQMARYLEVTDRSVREGSWRATAERRLRDADRISVIYDQMIKLRSQLARNAGFDNFRDYQHQRLHRFDYTPADCETFHTAVEQVWVPVLRRLNAERTRVLGLPALRPWDLKVDIHGRAPLRPFDGADDLVERTSKAFHRMDGELGRMFDSMRGGGCLDLDSRKGKAPGGYQYQRQYSRSPFIFMNAAGLQRDLETMVHEAGHAFHSILCKDDPILAYRGSPMEFAEVASMSMELLTFPVLDEFYSEGDANRARRGLLENLATMVPWIAQIDAFQHWVYMNPGHSHDERAAEWLRLNRRFGPTVDYSGLEEVERTAWQRQLHLFGVPFYYIEYGIAQLGALQLWLRSRRDPAAALAGYKRALALGGSQPLPKLFEAAGIRFEFGPAIMRELQDEVSRELERTAPASVAAATRNTPHHS
ncbi:MAG: M3 family oligoendopeptidase [Phycisphaeraceae bacterium]|nr:M3 family oligoendopeptidase [Phycisphaeraceae bacterium]